MYHPHLFARRAEMLALRDIAAMLPVSTTISPILEPVKSDSNDLLRCLETLGNAGITCTVITNPLEGDFRIAAMREPWRATLADRFNQFPNILPGFVCRATTTPATIQGFLDAYPNRNVAILYWSPNLTNGFLQQLAAEQRITFHINLLDQMSVAQRSLLPIAKAIDVEDHFTKQLRNADYGGPEFFSDDHLTFATNSIGFGDYSVIGANFVAGGGQAHAVAIHAMYLADAGTFWVEHFISDDVDLAVGTVEGKYLQAAGKLVDAVTLRPTEFGVDAALLGYQNDVNTNNFPGLATNKRRQIHHHLSLVHGFLSIT